MGLRYDREGSLVNERTSASMMLRCGDSPVFRTNCRKMEVFDMYVDRNFILALAERVLNMKTAGKEDWCIHWLEWFWQQEIETAIYDVKRRRPRCTAEAHADLLS